MLGGLVRTTDLSLYMTCRIGIGILYTVATSPDPYSDSSLPPPRRTTAARHVYRHGTRARLGCSSLACRARPCPCLAWHPFAGCSLLRDEFESPACTRRVKSAMARGSEGAMGGGYLTSSCHNCGNIPYIDIPASLYPSQPQTMGYLLSLLLKTKAGRTAILQDTAISGCCGCESAALPVCDARR